MQWGHLPSSLSVLAALPFLSVFSGTSLQIVWYTCNTRCHGRSHSRRGRSKVPTFASLVHVVQGSLALPVSVLDATDRLVFIVPVCSSLDGQLVLSKAAQPSGRGRGGPKSRISFMSHALQ